MKRHFQAATSSGRRGLFFAVGRPVFRACAQATGPCGPRVEYMTPARGCASMDGAPFLPCPGEAPTCRRHRGATDSQATGSPIVIVVYVPVIHDFKTLVETPSTSRQALLLPRRIEFSLEREEETAARGTPGRDLEEWVHPAVWISQRRRGRAGPGWQWGHHTVARWERTVWASGVPQERQGRSRRPYTRCDSVAEPERPRAST